MALGENAGGFKSGVLVLLEVFRMLYVSIALAVIVLIAALVFIRSLTRRHVSLLFRSAAGKLIAGGTAIEPAIQKSSEFESTSW